MRTKTTSYRECDLLEYEYCGKSLLILVTSGYQDCCRCHSLAHYHVLPIVVPWQDDDGEFIMKYFTVDSRVAREAAIIGRI